MYDTGPSEGVSVMKRTGFHGFTSFSDWLATQAHREDTVGAVARDAAADPHWPRKRTTLPAFVSYLYDRDGRNYSRESLETAWREYEHSSDGAAFNGTRPRV